MPELQVPELQVPELQVPESQVPELQVVVVIGGFLLLAAGRLQYDFSDAPVIPLKALYRVEIAVYAGT